MRYFTEAQARILAEFDKHYRARKISVPGNPIVWIIWDDESDHYVEFDSRTVAQLTESGVR